MAQYKYGDVVWVLASKRLGWWPARVENVDKLAPDLKKDVTEDTICVAKYLNEDNYQFVEDSNQICKYSSDRKEELISAGMKKYFEKKKVNETSSPFMKFPTDVKQAEYLTGGSPEIVDHERFQPKKATPAQSTYKNIFVDPRSKEISKAKSPIKSTSTPKAGRPPSNKAASPVANKVNHPRFQGNSDHEVRIRTQDNTPVLSSPTTSSYTSVSSGPSSANYACDLCAFSTTRLNLMVMHKKTHLNVGTASTLSSNVAAAQKRPTSSPSKKSPSKRVKKTAAVIVKEEEVAPPTLLSSGDLFDQVKRNLEAKESGNDSQTPPASEKASGKTPGRKRAPAKTPKTPKVPAAAKSTAKSPKSPAVTGNKSNESSTTKPLLNPKKKWLKSSMQSKSEVNPEVKIKLMADWDEEEEQQQSSKTESSATVNEGVTSSSSLTAKPEGDSEQERLSKSALIQQKSDDEETMDTENGTAHHQADENGIESKADEEESMAGISAEIDKLNADLNNSSRSTSEVPDVVIPTTTPPKLNGIHGCDTSLKSAPQVDSHGHPKPMKTEEEIKLDVASLLAETSVPVLPDVEGLSKVATAVVSEDTTIMEVGAEMESGNGDVEGGGNILMQVEGGETYMVVWEPGSEANIQELLAEGVVGDGDGTGTQTLLIDPSSLQAGSDLENLFQMAVAAVAPSSTPAPMSSSNEQSNSTVNGEPGNKLKSKRNTPRKGNKAKQAVGELFAKYGDASGKVLEPNHLVWAQLNPLLFVPASVLPSTEMDKQLTLVVFDILRPSNQRKFARNKIIPAFTPQLNMELLNFGRANNRKMDLLKMEKGYDHAHSYSKLRMSDFPQLSAREYLNCCNRSPVKLFSETYLTVTPDEEIREFPGMAMDSSLESNNEAEDDSDRKIKLIDEMLDQHILTDECLDHLASFDTRSSNRLKLYEERKWKDLSLIATCGILENFRDLYSKLADFLQNNVHRVRQLVENQDNKRIFVLDVLLPEALIYGVQKIFKVTAQEACHTVIYGIDKEQLPKC